MADIKVVTSKRKVEMEVEEKKIVIELNKVEAAELYALWYTSSGFNRVGKFAWKIPDLLGYRSGGSFMSNKSYNEKRYSHYIETLTTHARAWIDSFKKDHKEV